MLENIVQSVLMVGGDGGDDDVYLCRPVNIDVDLYYMNFTPVHSLYDIIFLSFEQHLQQL